MRLTYFATTLASLAALASASESEISGRPAPPPPPPPPPSPRLTFLYSLNCTLGTPLSVGATPNGDRVVIPITGGTFSGPRLSGMYLPTPSDLSPRASLTNPITGNVLNLGADWGLVGNDGIFSADTRYHLQTNDGANIFIRTSGPGQANGKIHLRIVFEAASAGAYGWLNNVVAVGVLTPGEGWVAIDTYELTST